MRILLVEDNKPLAEIIEAHLSKFHVLDLAFSLEETYYLLDTRSYDLLVFDVSLPDGDARELLPYLKENQIKVPILFMSASADFEDKLSCLRSGDDFLAKPCNLLELEARVQALLKRSANLANPPTLSLDQLSIDQAAHKVFLAGQEIRLNRKEFLLLELLLAHPQQVFGRASLAEKIWQEDEVLFGNSIETTIANLRRKLGRNLIRTVKGVGYSLNSLS